MYLCTAGESAVDVSMRVHSDLWGHDESGWIGSFMRRGAQARQWIALESRRLFNDTRCRCSQERIEMNAEAVAVRRSEGKTRFDEGEDLRSACDGCAIRGQRCARMSRTRADSASYDRRERREFSSYRGWNERLYILLITSTSNTQVWQHIVEKIHLQSHVLLGIMTVRVGT